MSKNQGKFVWYELLTPDLKGAEAFYREVVGWEIKNTPMPGMQYSILSAGETMVGGMMTLSAEMKAAGTPPCWSGYVDVDTVDDYARRVTAAGGSIKRPPMDIPQIGRFCVVADPHGAVFILFQSFNPEGEKKDGMCEKQVNWHELHTGTKPLNFDFYANLFGWTKDQALDMGPMGTYQIFKPNTAQPAGGMMQGSAERPHAYWMYYFGVKGIDAAVERIKKGGGKIVHGPIEVPGGAWIINGIDPQGAAFALVGPK